MKFNVISSKIMLLYTWNFGFSLSFTPRGPFRGVVIDFRFVRWMWSIILSIPPKNIRKRNMFNDLNFDFEEYINDSHESE